MLGDFAAGNMLPPKPWRTLPASASKHWRKRRMPQKANDLTITALAAFEYLRDTCGRSGHDLGQLSTEFGDAQLIE